MAVLRQSLALGLLLATVIGVVVGGVVVRGEDRTAPSEVAGSSAPVSSDEIRSLVGGLGAERFDQRRTAAARLSELGQASRQALLEGLDHRDPEVRRSCRRILADILDADYSQRLERFLADVHLQQQHDLPGWQTFERLVGRSEASHDLFAEMQRAERGLLASTEAGEEAAAEALIMRFRVFSDARQQIQPTLGSIAAMLLVCSDQRLDLPSWLIDHHFWVQMVQNPVFRQALAQEGPKQPLARKLLGQWIARPSGLNLLQTKLVLATEHEVPEGLQLALETVFDQQGVHRNYRVHAIHAIARLGGPEYAGALQLLLNDDGECQRRSVRMANKTRIIAIQMRDVALAWLIELTEQRHADYGMAAAGDTFKQFRQNPRYVNIANLYFESEDERAAALKKWKAWVAAHPLAELPDDARAAAEHPGQPKPPAAPPPGAAQAQQAAKTPPDEPPPTSDLQATDREMAMKLVRARRLIEQREYVEATLLLGAILKSERDYMYRPDSDVPLALGLKAAADNLLAQLPLAGRSAYVLHFGAEAEQALSQAVESADVEAIGDVAKRYFHTPAGAEATYLLGCHHLDQNQPLRGSLYFDRLIKRSAYADDYEPALSVKLATCCAIAGMRQQAEQALRRVDQGQWPPVVTVAGQTEKLFAGVEPLEWLDQRLGAWAAAGTPGGWLMFRGDQARNQLGTNNEPFLADPPLWPVHEASVVRELVDQLQQSQLEQHEAKLPALHPLVVRNSVLFRTGTHLRALDAASGELLWETPLEDSLRALVRHEVASPDPRQREVLSRGLARRLWDDATFGTMSSDGRLVYGVEDLAFGVGGDVQHLTVLADGRQRLDPGDLKDYNLLAAYDIRSGKLQWEIGGPPGPSPLPLAGTYFLGPPLPLGGRLYTVATIDNQTHLLELDAQSGRQLWELTLTDGPVVASPEPGFPYWPEQPRLRRSGASPSCADGVLVCPISANGYVGVDLATRSVMWFYQPPEDAAPVDPRFGNILWQKSMLEASADPGDRWFDGSVTIAGGRVLLTPVESDHLFCLDHAAGSLRWVAGRNDGLFIGGVYDDLVIVVGRGWVRGLRLEDGTPAWPPVALPKGAVPSGRGFLAEQRYYLPLSTAEVAAFDVTAGRLVARSRSAQGIVPGNLTSYNGAVFSQGPLGVWRFASLPDRVMRLSGQLRARPDDPQLLADAGEALLFQGQVRQAIDHFQRSLAREPTDRTRRLLVEAVVEGLGSDFAAYAPQLKQLEILLAERFEGDRELLEQLSMACQEAGEPQLALGYYRRLAIGDLGDQNLDKLEYRSDGWWVRRDRWLAGRLAELQTADGDVVKQIDAWIGQLPAAKVAQLWGHHASADRARLEWASELLNDEQWLHAEWLLRGVLHSNKPQLVRAAVARLAGLYADRQRTSEAARLYAHLNSELRDEICLDGLTGAELVDRLPADSPVRARMHQSDAWPLGLVESTSSGARANYQYPVAVETERGPFSARAALSIDTAGRNIRGFDSNGRQAMQIALEAPNSKWGISGNVFSHTQANLQGHLVVAWLGNRVCGIDALDGQGKPIWSHDIYTTEPPQPGMWRPAILRRQMPRQFTGMPGAERRLLHVTAGGVCFQQDYRILAVDPLTGKPLWSRGSFADECDLFGDEQLLFVTEPDAGEAVVLSILDGRELGRRKVPAVADRVTMLGRHVLTWQASAEHRQLSLVDPWEAQIVWQRRFHQRAQTWLVGNELGVLDPAGQFQLLRLESGEPALTTQLDPQPELSGLVVLRAAEGYCVVANRESAPANGPFNVMAFPYAVGVPVNGRAYAVNRATGEQKWSRDIEDQILITHQPENLPLLVFSSFPGWQDPSGSNRGFKLVCWDNRSGEVLYDETTSNPGYNFLLEIEADPEKHAVEIRSQRSCVQLRFTGRAPPVKNDDSPGR